MPKITDDIKAGFKGVRGAGDVIRGEFLDATDRVFDKHPNHPPSVDRESKNHSIAEKGRQDLRNADETFARHEWERKEAAASEELAHGHAGAGRHTGAATSTAAHGPTHATTTTAAAPPPLPARHAENTMSRGGHENEPVTDAMGRTEAAYPDELGTHAAGHSAPATRYA